MKNICFVVGARPNFIKLAPIMDKIGKFPELNPVILHTGQHFDSQMSDIFFDELNIPKPDFNLNIGADTPTKQTAKIMSQFEDFCLENKPDMVVVIGDVSTTLAAALVCSKLLIPLAHIEAGLRSHNRTMPEEVNRVVTDHLSDLLFAPSQNAIGNLRNEGLTENTYFTGDVMFDAALRNIVIAASKSDILNQLKLKKKSFYLATLHRPYNVDDPQMMKEILSAFSELSSPVLFPVHPRTAKNLEEFGLYIDENVILCEPVGYFDSLILQRNAIKVITDSGGVQKESLFLQTPCVTLRPETEWIETVEIGSNLLVQDRRKYGIIDAVLKEQNFPERTDVYGDGNAAEKILSIINHYFS